MASYWILLVHLYMVVSIIDGRTSPNIQEYELEHSRHKRDNNPSWKYTQFQINALRTDMMNYDVQFCDGNPFIGIQCTEERLCALWEEVCDGHQKCALPSRERCLNQSKLSYGATDVRICDGDENVHWCAWKLQAPIRCGKDYTIKGSKALSRKIRIYSPNWPKPYTNDRFCYWTVTAAEGHRLSVRVKKFKTEQNFDFISIGNGVRYDEENSVVVFRHSGRKKPVPHKFNSKSNQLWISFRSDDWENAKGFYIEIADTLSWDAGMVGPNPFRSNTPNKDCGKDITLAANEDYRLTSPGYPQSYNNNVECVWIVRIAAGRRMHVHFEVFDLEDELDYLSLGNGDDSRRAPLLYKQSGRSIPVDVITKGNALWVKFVASLAIARAGFVINIQDDPFRDCGTEEITIKTINPGTSVLVATPNYPSAYPANTRCVYRFQTKPGRRLEFRILDFSSEYYYDRLSFGNGDEPNESTAVVWEHHGSRLPDTVEFTSDGSTAWLLFNSDSIGSDRGVLAEVFEVASENEIEE